ncbi:MAG: apolipoprotein N-acyltransferase [Verrucomicrobia bacterium]|nr:apolipoprotein N-acyltransferase [Verrucomicrobiota bacterium]
MVRAFSLTPALSRWEREDDRLCVEESEASRLLSEKEKVSLSQRERAGVREKSLNFTSRLHKFGDGVASGGPFRDSQNLRFDPIEASCGGLKFASLTMVFRGRILLAVAAGFLWTLAFPRFGMAGFGWIVPGLMLMLTLGVARKSAFGLGYIAGVAHYLTSLHWLLFIPFPVGAFAGWLALSCYLALYPATWVWLCWRLFPTTLDHIQPGSCGSNHERHESREGSVGMSAHLKPEQGDFHNRFCFRVVRVFRGFDLSSEVHSFVATPLSQRALWAVACAVVWVALEMVLARFLTGFPWNFLGVSQYQMLPVIQIAAITGVYGVSFLMVWFSAALACSSLSLVVRPTAARIWLGDLLFPSLGLLSACWFGVQQTSERQTPAETLRIALVQPSIPQTLIWDPAENTNRFNQLLRLSKQALEAKPDLLVWPEAAIPDLLRYELETLASVQRLAIDYRVWMILGADDAVPRADSATGKEYDFYNSSFLISPEGEIVGEYRKRRLVIFGEYVPLARWLPIMKYFTPIGDGFKAGERPTRFSVPGLNVNTSVLICFEDTLPQWAREHVGPETDFLLNLTNNGWFGESAAQWQHAANAAFRAVENGLPLVRCTNNGLSCWIDASGGIHDVYYPGSPDIYRAGFKIVTVPIRRGGQHRRPTVYTRYGDWFGWGCLVLAALHSAGAWQAQLRFIRTSASCS